MPDTLPIDAVLPDVIRILRRDRRLVLQAPPGAGKTTRVPLEILSSGTVTGKILILEPRRLAARAAAERMAQTLGEPVGHTVGYRIRGQSKVGPETRIEVLTEGILTRMLQDTPDLPGVGCIIFDEFHERSLNADLGLALCLEIAEALRGDLCLVAMSATLDAGAVADLMQSEILTSEGRSFPVTEHWLEKPRRREQRLEAATADLVQHALTHEPGSVLVFLPGEAEIRRTEALLANHVPDDVSLHPLFGAMDFSAQRAAIAPAPSGRKVVLATSIAETSLTIEGIRVVVDAGLSRRAEFDPSSSMSRLVTGRVTRAEATQRAGRAGRLAPGACYKLWTKGEDGALAGFPPADIEAGDLTALALEIALWGTRAEDMRFLTPPHEGRLAEAQAVLRMLGALDQEGRITSHGRALARLPLHPRLAHMVVRGGPDAALLAALLAERDPLRGAPCDIGLRVAAARDPKAFERKQGVTPHHPTVMRIRDEAKRLKRFTSVGGEQRLPVLAALAYPDRIGTRRQGDAPRFLLSGGKGAVMPQDDSLAGARMIVATDLDGDPREARIRQAIAFDAELLRETFPDQVAWQNVCVWSRRAARVETRREERFGALVLESRNWTDAPKQAVATAMLEGIRQIGLRPANAASRLMARAVLMRSSDPGFPDLSEATLMDSLEHWLVPFLDGIRTAEQWKGFDILPALEARLGWEGKRALDQAVPSCFQTPLGRKVPIDYSGGTPGIALRLQELFGVTRHPVAAGQPLQITLLSPAQRPVQVTTDLPGFWATSYVDVRKDMRGRYPKHPWPEDPTQADPTLRAKPRR